MDTRKDLLKMYHPSGQTPKEMATAGDVVMDALYHTGSPAGNYSSVFARYNYSIPNGIMVYGDSDGRRYRFKGGDVFRPEMDTFDEYGTGSSWIDLGLVECCNTGGSIMPEVIEDRDRYLFSDTLNFPVSGDSSVIMANAIRQAVDESKILLMQARPEPYMFANTSLVNLVNDEEVRIVLDGGAVLKGATGLDVPLLKVVGNYSGSVDLSGSGKIDMSLGTHVSGTQSSTGLAANNLDTLTVRGIYFYAGEDYLGEHGDSGITAGGTRVISITDNCRFQGWSDLGIYLTGDNDMGSTFGDGKQATIAGNYFYKNRNDISSKRQYTSCKITDNHFEGSLMGVTTFSADGSTLPGKNLICSNNTFDRVARPVSVRLSDNAVVSDNIFLNWGTEFVTGIDYGSNLRAVQVQGSKNCNITGNVFDSRNTTPSFAVEIADYTYNGTFYPGGSCHVDGIFTSTAGGTRAFADIAATVASSVRTTECGMNPTRSGYSANTIADRTNVDLSFRQISKGTTLTTVLA